MYRKYLSLLALNYSVLFARSFTLIGIYCLLTSSLLAQQPHLSPRTANFDIRIHLDDENKQIRATQQLTFVNPSADTIWSMPFHMYYNAFKNNQTVFMTRGGRIPRNKSEEDLENCTWGWIEVTSVTDEQGHTLEKRYIRPDLPNEQDETVLEVLLVEPILPFASYTLQMEWRSQIPKLMIRTGYNQNYFFMAQWYPKLGVYEPAGTRFAEKGAWNCHQYHANTEYYGEFGVYNVHIDVPSAYKVGASGSRISKQTNGNRTTHHFLAEDVIDFSWVAYPRFEEITHQWKDVKINLFLCPEHRCTEQRFVESASYALSFFEEYISSYPYPELTIVSPPYHGLNSGAMEYPTLFTSPTLCALPYGIKTTETLTIHELTHQYFMQMLATNEQEEPWLDEGFTSYFEAKIMDELYPEGVVSFPFWKFGIGSRALRRGRFMAADNRRVNPISDFGWHFEHGSYAEIVYGKSACWLFTLEGLIGEELMQKILYTYFQRWKFKHPSREDFRNVLLDVVPKETLEELHLNLDVFFNQGILQTVECDYEVASISNANITPKYGYLGDTLNCIKPSDDEKTNAHWRSQITVYRRGDYVVPQEILVHFADGSEQQLNWDGVAASHSFEFIGDYKVVSAIIDPDRKIVIDINYLNNSKTIEPTSTGISRYFFNLLSWLAQLLVSVSSLV